MRLISWNFRVAVFSTEFLTAENKGPRRLGGRGWKGGGVRVRNTGKLCK